MMPEDKVKAYLAEAEEKAIKNMARGKWSQFGYWAAHAVHLRRILGVSHTASPFREFKELAKEKLNA